ncbi:MAG: 16S rRNA (cytidine(1402)-2'-O)-methyltransferase [Candidatus Omnitrophota bacterium]|jgi:16S rRNA (cytidine1402-2'-O)-methyltransferase|nr:16S rRNA (cytidine(1402)-2'-O)-methyltransferase [Candidatus Omnitrophota bacterium]MDD5517771.1 16S rRNA (cytidine(1402)-2'-O)-methyltransferase [Candidatus Omnitrophota bacterium]
MLYIVATPIGNLKDITLRAMEVLRSVDLIACEDTRHTKILLNHYAIHKPTTSFYQHNRFTKAEYLLGFLKEGKDIALVSDAGTPGILDPGYNLINLAIRNNIAMTLIPGPSALINALVLSGKPAHEFYFAGFLPPKRKARQNKLQELFRLKCTVICYESSHRILASLEDMEEIFGAKEIAVARELTKKFEEVTRASPRVILEKIRVARPRGEFVIAI